MLFFYPPNRVPHMISTNFVISLSVITTSFHFQQLVTLTDVRITYEEKKNNKQLINRYCNQRWLSTQKTKRNKKNEQQRFMIKIQIDSSSDVIEIQIQTYTYVEFFFTSEFAVPA